MPQFDQSELQQLGCNRQERKVQGWFSQLRGEKQRWLGLLHLKFRILIKQELWIHYGTMPMQTSARSGMEGDNSSNDSNTNRSGRNIGNATFSNLSGSHTVIMVGPKAPPNYGCILSRGALRRFYRAHEEYERYTRISIEKCPCNDTSLR